MAKEATKNYPYRVRAFTGMTVDYAKTIGAQTLVRGLRMSSDFEREFGNGIDEQRAAAGPGAGMPDDQFTVSISSVLAC